MGQHSRKARDIELVLGAVYDPERTGYLTLPPRPPDAADHHRPMEQPTVPFKPVTVRFLGVGRHRLDPELPTRPQDVRAVVKTVVGVVSTMALAVVVGLVLNRDPSVQSLTPADAAADMSAGGGSSSAPVSPVLRDLLTKSGTAEPTTQAADPPVVEPQQPVQPVAPAMVVPPPETTQPPAQTTTAAPPPPAPPAPPPVDPFCDTEASCKAYSEVIVTPSQLGCFQEVVRRESSWNIFATNSSSGAYGLGQALPADKYATAGIDWRTNGATQLRWTLAYMNERYGSPCAALAFHDSHNWY